MAADLISTRARRLTFCASMKVTFRIFYLPWYLWAGFLRALWFDGATASLKVTNLKTGKSVTVNVSKRHVTVE